MLCKEPIGNGIDGSTGHVHALFTVTEKVIRATEFSPAMVDGEPVSMRISFPAEFRLMLNSDDIRDGNGEASSPDTPGLDQVIVVGYGSMDSVEE